MGPPNTSDSHGEFAEDRVACHIVSLGRASLLSIGDDLGALGGWVTMFRPLFLPNIL
jgi:hypothetical protein